MSGTLSDERTDMLFTIAAGPRQRSHSRSESRGTHDKILLSQIRDSPTWRTRSPHLCSTGTGWPSYTPMHLVPFSLLPKTRRGTVDVYKPASTQVTSKGKVFPSTGLGGP
jgi:hypothetical protein